jgi:hypothetical protein
MRTSNGQYPDSNEAPCPNNTTESYEASQCQCTSLSSIYGCSRPESMHSRTPRLLPPISDGPQAAYSRPHQISIPLEHPHRILSSPGSLASPNPYHLYPRRNIDQKPLSTLFMTKSSRGFAGEISGIPERIHLYRPIPRLR